MLYPEGVKVIINPDSTEDVSPGGIIIPPTVQDKHQIAVTRGTIVAIGPSADVKFADDTAGVLKREAKIGDKVIFARYGGAMIKERTDGNKEPTELRILNDEDIVCLIK